MKHNAPSAYKIRPLTTLEDCRKVAELERVVWGYTDAEDVVPPTEEQEIRSFQNRRLEDQEYSWLESSTS